MDQVGLGRPCERGVSQPNVIVGVREVLLVSPPEGSRRMLGMSSVRWNAVCVECGPDRFEAMVAFYAALLELEVVDKEPRGGALRDPAGRMGINVQADDAYVAPVWPQATTAQSMMMLFEIGAADVPASVERATMLG